MKPTPPDQCDPDGRWPALAILAVAVLLSMMTWSSASAVVPRLRAEWGTALTLQLAVGFS